MSGERWEPVGVAAYRDFYEVSDLGRVRRSAPGKRTRPGVVLKPSLSIRRHPLVKLSAGGVSRSFAVAPLVAAAFLPAGPPGAILGHRAGDRSNCAASNLEWAKRKYREPHAGHRRKLSAPQEAEAMTLLGVLSAR